VTFSDESTRPAPPGGSSKAASAPRVSIVAPTYNEAKNIAELTRRLGEALPGVDWEVIFVDDDSPDGTYDVAKALANDNPRVRCIRRVNRRGLSGACIEGILSSAATYVVVMDADLQHDERIIPEMLRRLETDEAEIVVGSRLVEGGSSSEGLSSVRQFASTFAMRFARALIGTDVSDLMSGFFAMRRDRFEAMAPRLTTSGFKILLDVLATASPPLRASEVGYRFRARFAGDSKFDLRAMTDFFTLVVHKVTGGVVPPRFVMFILVGGLGVFIHLAVLRVAMSAAETSFAVAQTIATLVAMTSNFFINNLLTYSDAKLRGARAVIGLAKFYAVCGIGAAANVGVATWLFGLNSTWWLAGIAGIVMSSVWNYTMSSLFIWRRAD
jgi:dolichol-phosphate mannosyltransferase